MLHLGQLVFEVSSAEKSGVEMQQEFQDIVIFLLPDKCSEKGKDVVKHMCCLDREEWSMEFDKDTTKVGNLAIHQMDCSSSKEE
eukprot:CAMPEP_0117755398 /NCGR_PEP_ID=MMETSP0947-20121206/13429_1 /TAXON_ID=44440 /ORGANISM="Chattonella subsalsa, Strain CCMP2191" /LENGTH=83 /DNA_ID=CAMNT_0005574727 /DNA_START=296 /DNA_END=547 /DNA_ORIENTATION=+